MATCSTGHEEYPVSSAAMREQHIDVTAEALQRQA